MHLRHIHFFFESLNTLGINRQFRYHLLQVSQHRPDLRLFLLTIAGQIYMEDDIHKNFTYKQFECILKDMKAISLVLYMRATLVFIMFNKITTRRRRNRHLNFGG